MNYAFRNGKILDGTKEMKIQQGLCILVENGIITDLIPDANADLHNYKVIDLHGQYILPGLINMHVHLAGNGKPQKKQRDNEKLVKTIMSSSLTRTIAYKMVAAFAKDELFSGVTTIRTVGGLGILILVCAMKLNPALNLALAFLLQIRESPFQVVIWLDRLQLPHRPFQMH